MKILPEQIHNIYNPDVHFEHVSLSAQMWYLRLAHALVPLDTLDGETLFQLCGDTKPSTVQSRHWDDVDKDVYESLAHAINTLGGK